MKNKKKQEPFEFRKTPVFMLRFSLKIVDKIEIK